MCPEENQGAISFCVLGVCRWTLLAIFRESHDTKLWWMNDRWDGVLLLSCSILASGIHGGPTRHAGNHVLSSLHQADRLYIHPAASDFVGQRCCRRLLKGCITPEVWTCDRPGRTLGALQKQPARQRQIRCDITSKGSSSRPCRFFSPRGP